MTRTAVFTPSAPLVCLGQHCLTGSGSVSVLAMHTGMVKCQGFDPKTMCMQSMHFL